MSSISDNVIESFFAELGPEHGESLFDCLPDLQFYIKNTNGRYLRANVSLVEVLAKEDSQVVGKTDFDLAPAFLADLRAKDDRTVLQGHSVRNQLQLLGSGDFRLGWFISNKIPLYSRSQKIVGFAGCWRECSQVEDPTTAGNEISKTLRFINQHFEEPIKLQDIADLVDLSIRGLQERFRRHLRISPSEYLRRLRLSKACRELILTNDTISQIAHRTGFCDHSYLSKEILKATGNSPKDFRESHSILTKTV